MEIKPDAFDPPADHMGLDVLIWPSLDDQVRYIKKRHEQVGRVLQHYTGQEMDYRALVEESTSLTAVMRTLCTVRDIVAQSPRSTD